MIVYNFENYIWKIVKWFYYFIKLYYIICYELFFWLLILLLVYLELRDGLGFVLFFENGLGEFLFGVIEGEFLGFKSL